jgi:hypothetical protein
VRERRRLRAFELRLDRPVLLGLERQDLALALADDPHGDRLHAPGRQPAPHLVPEERRQLVAHEPVEHAARLLRVVEVLSRSRGFLIASCTAFFVISLKRTRRTFFFLGYPSFWPMCHAMASPSRSGSEARKTFSLSCAAFLISARTDVFPLMTWYSASKSFSMSTPSFDFGRSITWPIDAFTW